MMKHYLPLLLLISLPSFANDFCYTAEQKLNDLYTAYKNYSDTSPSDDELANTVVSILKDPKSKACTWENLAEFNISYSSDKRLMAMDWQIDVGGTMRTYAGAWQYNDGKKLYAGGGQIGYVTDISQMTLNGKTVYFVSEWEAGYTSLHAQTLSLWTFDKTELVPANLIKTKERLTNEIDFAYNPFLTPKTGIHQERLIHINPKKKEFTIPVVIEDMDKPEYGANGRVTNRTLKYRFDGKVFKYVK